jgi:acetyl-CoA carboxylase biotin carboxyl carrier protein
MKINEAAIRKLAKLLEETGLGEIEVVEGEQVLRVSRGSVSGGQTAARPIQMSSDPTVPQPANTQAPAAIAQEHPGAIVSPMVGTVYLSPEPGAPPFVRKGETVKAGDTLLIIEAMKVMNPIKADKGGTVTHVLVENGKPIEFGEVLMVIE